MLSCVTAITPTRAHDMVNILHINPTIRLDIRYATDNNFTHKKVYRRAECYLRQATALKLDAVQRELQEKHRLGLKIFDGYRPQSVQFIFWELVPDERYVADPNKGSRHNRGAAVDVTLVDHAGNQLIMPTDFDDFTEKAHRDYMSLPAEAIKNRQILENVMVKHGFVGIQTEWWHFDDKDWQQYAVLDIPFEELATPKK